MRTTGKAAFGRVRPRHEALGSDSAMRVAPGSEQTVGRRGETSGARDGLTLRPKVLETRGMLALARVQGRGPN
jgi:hypothetical protein